MGRATNVLPVLMTVTQHCIDFGNTGVARKISVFPRYTLGIFITKCIEIFPNCYTPNV